MSKLVFKEGQPGDFLIAPPNVEVFIETGTSTGETLANAVEVFKECHSVEFHHPTYLESSKRFLHEPKAKVYYGSSPLVLPYLIDPKKPTMFWLDAHFVPGLAVPPDVYGQCPLLAELDAIMSVNWEAPFFVLIDDAMCFGEEFWNTPVTIHNNLEYVVIANQGHYCAGMKRDEWPTIPQIKAKLPRHRVDVIVTNNVIMGVPLG